MRTPIWQRLSRRRALSGGIVAAGGAIVGALPNGRPAVAQPPDASHGANVATTATHASANPMITVGDVGSAKNGFDPTATGTVSQLPDGRTLRTFEIEGQDKEIEIASGVLFPAWTYNGRVPGPTLRATEGDHLRVVFRNRASHPHSMHFHGIHAARMDGVPGAGLIEPGQDFVYEFDALPFGCHLYHCHALPLRRHISKGMYGAFIVDPDPARHPESVAVAQSRLLGTVENKEWQELVMVMNGFDTNFDRKNETYAVNTIAHHFMKHPIRIDHDRPVRIYLVNVLEFDLINSFHLHGNFFDYYDHGTTLMPTLTTVDTVMQCQAQRGILEFTYRKHETGAYMFHAHQSEFAELGWMGMFDVVAVAS
jgi:FtsP/CotA-like multicopper oxidase with cupredoxin domain